METKRKLACYIPWQQMIIGIDGNVSPCSFYQGYNNNYPSCGNVNKSGIMEIWNGEVYQNLRKFMLSSEGKDGCPGCLEVRLGTAGYLYKPVVTGCDCDDLIEQSKSWKNYHCMLQEIDEGKAELSSKPTCISYSPSCDCNFNCDMCYETEMREQKLRTPKKTDQEVLELIPYLTELIPGGGEPFVEPLWKHFIETYEQKLNPCLFLAVTTNGSLLDEALIRKLSVFPSVSINFSFDATTKELFESIRVGGNFESVYANLVRCIEHRNAVEKGNFYISACMTVQKPNVHDLVNMLQMMREREVHIAFSPLISFPVPLSLIHYHDAPEEIGRIKTALIEAKGYYEKHMDMQEKWSRPCRQIEVIDEMIPYHLLDKEHHWVEGTIPSPFPQWCADMYGKDTKPYILFFPIENGKELPCQYYAPVEDWRYRARLPEGEYLVALTKYHIASGPWSNWRVKIEKNTPFVIIVEPKPLDWFLLTAKNSLRRIPFIRKIVQNLKKRTRKSFRTML